MSDTKRYIKPNETGTEKYQSRDRKSKKKDHRFMLGSKNSRYNLEQKNEQLSLQEHLEE